MNVTGAYPAKEADPPPFCVAVCSERVEDRHILQCGLSRVARITEHVTLKDAEDELAADRGRPDGLIVTSDRADKELIQALKAVIDRLGIATILFAQADPEGLAPSAVRAGISAFVVDGLDAQRVLPILQVAIERSRMVTAMQSELQKSQEQLASRKLVERAKGLLMEHRDMTEQQAYKTLRDLAMRQSKPMRDVAESVISMSDLLP